MKSKILGIIFIALICLTLLTLVGIPIFAWLAFGPEHSSGEIEITNNQLLEYKQVYNGDFAGTFYDVTFYNDTSVIGTYTFHNGAWVEDLLVDSISGRTFVFFADSNIDNSRLIRHYLISYKTNFENIIDTTYEESEGFNPQNKMEEIINLD